MLDILKRHFGYDRFRPLQEEIIRHVLDGKDCLALMPTGGGKSLCFQMPSLVTGGLTVVVSPLIALMKDQVDQLTTNLSLRSSRPTYIRRPWPWACCDPLVYNPASLLRGGFPLGKSAHVRCHLGEVRGR